MYNTYDIVYVMLIAMNAFGKIKVIKKTIYDLNKVIVEQFYSIK